MENAQPTRAEADACVIASHHSFIHPSIHHSSFILDPRPWTLEPWLADNLCFFSSRVSSVLVHVLPAMYRSTAGLRRGHSTCARTRIAPLRWRYILANPLPLPLPLPLPMLAAPEITRLNNQMLAGYRTLVHTSSVSLSLINSSTSPHETDPYVGNALQLI